MCLKLFVLEYVGEISRLCHVYLDIIYMRSCDNQEGFDIITQVILCEV